METDAIATLTVFC